MNAYLLPFALALVTGLRTFVPIFALRWPYGNWTTIVAGLFCAGELVADKLPNVPARTQVAPLLLRAIFGSYAAWAVGTPLGLDLRAAIAIGIAGSVIGAYSGYFWRMKVVPAIHLPPLLGALAEDAVALVVAFWIVLGAH